MDWITHSAAGAFIAWAWPRRWAVAGATPFVVAAALLPDLDSYIEPYPDFGPGSDFGHRGFTHSLFGAAVIAPVIALVPLWLSKEKRSYIRYARLVALIAAGILTHVVLDLPTEIGAKVFYPFYRKIVYLDWLGHIDFTLFTLSVFVLLAAWTYSKREAAVLRGILSSALLASFSWWFFADFPSFALRIAQNFGELEKSTEEPFRTVYPLILGGMLLCVFAAFARKGWVFRQNRALFGRIGLAAFSIYLFVCGAAQWLALNQIEQFTRERGLEVLARAATRAEAWSFVGPRLWTGLVLAPEGVYRAEISPFSARRPTFRFFANAAENAFVARSRSMPTVQAFLSSARFPLSCYQVEGSQHIVEFYDYGAGNGVVRVALNERLETLAVGWIGMTDYVSKASPSHTAIPDNKVGPNIVPQRPPCFLH
jgi:membrane-bound metal-dependent hydrolase YbcI (DUF457 family)